MSGVDDRPARSASYLDTYSNQIRIGLSATDFTLIFGATDDLGPGEIGQEDRVAVRLSPQSVKLLFLQLEGVLGAYEHSMGAIKMPSRVIAEIQRNKQRLSAQLEANEAFDPSGNSTSSGN